MKKENKTIAIHYAPNSMTKLIKLSNGMYNVHTKVDNAHEKNNFFEKHQEHQAKELFQTLSSINY